MSVRARASKAAAVAAAGGDVYDRMGFLIDPDDIPAYTHTLAELEHREKLFASKWTSFVTKNIDSSEQIFPTREKLIAMPKFRALVFKGIPDKYRPTLWMILSGADVMKASASPTYYADLSARAMSQIKTLKNADDIEKDLTRTFPGHQKFSGPNASQGIDPLRRLLLTYSIRNESVGYCQSMNVLAGWLLLVMNSEEDAFWMLCAIVEKACPRYYTPSMVGCQVDIRVFTDMLQQVCPQLYKMFETIGLSLPVATTRWFLCLFVTVVPSETALRIWDTFFLHGTLILFRASLAVLKQLEPLFLNCRDTNMLIKIVQQKPRSLYNHRVMFRHMKNMKNVAQKDIVRWQAEHSKAVREEMEGISKRKDIQILLRTTKFDRNDLDRLSKKFSSMKGIERTAKGGAALNFTMFQELITQTMPAWHQDTEQLNNMFRVFDQDADGLLNFRELLMGLSMLSSADSEEKLKMMFRLHDTNNDGKLSYERVCGLLKSIYLAAGRDVSDEHFFTTYASKLFVSLDIPEDEEISEEQVGEAIHNEPVLEEALNVDLFDAVMKMDDEDQPYQGNMQDIDDDDDDDDDDKSESVEPSDSSAPAPTTTTTTTTTTTKPEGEEKKGTNLQPVVPQASGRRPGSTVGRTRKPSQRDVVDRLSYMFGSASVSGEGEVYQDVNMGSTNHSSEANGDSGKASACMNSADKHSTASLQSMSHEKNAASSSSLQQPLLNGVDTTDDSDEITPPKSPSSTIVNGSSTVVKSSTTTTTTSSTAPVITDELANAPPELDYQDLEGEQVCCSPLRECFKTIWRKILVCFGI